MVHNKNIITKNNNELTYIHNAKINTNYLNRILSLNYVVHDHVVLSNLVCYCGKFYFLIAQLL